MDAALFIRESVYQGERPFLVGVCARMYSLNTWAGGGRWGLGGVEQSGQYLSSVYPLIMHILYVMHSKHPLIIYLHVILVR